MEFLESSWFRTVQIESSKLYNTAVETRRQSPDSLDFASIHSETPAHEASSFPVVGVVEVVRSPLVGDGARVVVGRESSALSSISVGGPRHAYLGVQDPDGGINRYGQHPRQAATSRPLIRHVPVYRGPGVGRRAKCGIHSSPALLRVSVGRPAEAELHVVEPGRLEQGLDRSTHLATLLVLVGVVFVEFGHPAGLGAELLPHAAPPPSH